MNNKIRAVFLDRDGVLNKKPAEHDYVKKISEFKWNINAKKLVKKINSAGYVVVVISNQAGIAKGKMSKEFVKRLHTKINRDLDRIGTSIRSFYFCAHHKDEKCICRKPEPGLFHLAVEELNIDIKASYMIGDSKTDIEAAMRAGCKNAILIESNVIDLDYILKSIP